MAERALTLLAFLVAWLAMLRATRGTRLPAAHARWGRPQGAPLTWILAALVCVLASTPLLRELPFLLSKDVPLYADAPTHAAIAQELARHGAPHGWIESYDGGFPLGVNYPPLGWLAATGLIRLGLAPATAVQSLGLLPYVLAPVLVLFAARSAGARPLAALLGSLTLVAIAPFNGWLGTYESYLGLGLLSQAMAVPLVILCAWSVIGEGARWLGPIAGALLAAAHPQITAAAFLLALPAALLCSRPARRRMIRVAAGAAIAGAALYGPGLVHLELPFGWVPFTTASWIAGYSLERAYDWLADATLFDMGRAPVVTTLSILCVLFLTLLARRRAPRIALVTMIASIGLSLAGRGLGALGPFGEWLSSFLQPQRAFALVPFALAGAFVVAAEEVLSRASRLDAAAILGGKGGTVARGFVLVVGATLFAAGLSTMTRRLKPSIALEHAWLDGQRQCGRVLAARDVVATLGSTAFEGGRLQSVEVPPLWECGKYMGVELRSDVPLGVSVGAGAHVGMLAWAMKSLAPEKPGGALRAESLGLRWLLHDEKTEPLPPGAWRIRHEDRGVRISERIGGTDIVGVGCVERMWSGSYSAIRRALVEDIGASATSFADPRSLTVLEETRGPLVEVAVPRGSCDPSGARVQEVRREPGAYEARVATSAEVDVVVRATAYRGWVVTVDGEVRPTRKIAPGFFAVRVGPGAHHVVAVVHPPRGYGAGLVVAAIAIALLAALGRRVRRA